MIWRAVLKGILPVSLPLPAQPSLLTKCPSQGKGPLLHSPDLTSAWRRKGWHQEGRARCEPEHLCGYMGKRGVLLPMPAQLQWGARANLPCSNYYLKLLTRVCIFGPSSADMSIIFFFFPPPCCKFHLGHFFLFVDILLFSFDHFNSSFDPMSPHLSPEAQPYYIIYTNHITKTTSTVGFCTTYTHVSICNNCAEVNTDPWFLTTHSIIFYL